MAVSLLSLEDNNLIADFLVLWVFLIDAPWCLLPKPQGRVCVVDEAGDDKINCSLHFDQLPLSEMGSLCSRQLLTSDGGRTSLPQG